MFSTLQRPTLEELERRRAMRETFSPPRSSTLQRRESVISRGFNALFRDGGYRRMPISREGLQDLLSKAVKSANCFPFSILPLAPCLVLDLATGGSYRWPNYTLFLLVGKANNATRA